MPVMDGVTATRLIREAHSSARLPVVAMTANARAVDRERCVEAGMNGFVTKPIDPQDLWRALLEQFQSAKDPQAQGPGSATQVGPGPSGPRPSMTAVIDALRGIAALDVDLGLQRTTNNARLYASLLRKFVAGQADAPERMHALLRAGDAAAAERIAHTLKSVAGTLGAVALQGSAEELEAALRSDADGAALEAALADTTRTLERLMAQIRDTPELFAAA